MPAKTIGMKNSSASGLCGLPSSATMTAMSARSRMLQVRNAGSRQRLRMMRSHGSAATTTAPSSAAPNTPASSPRWRIWSKTAT